jgi:hypothetical protein
MAVQRQTEKPAPRPTESRNPADNSEEDLRDQPTAPSNEDVKPADDEAVEDDSEGPLTDPEAEPGKPI